MFYSHNQHLLLYSGKTEILVVSPKSIRNKMPDISLHLDDVSVASSAAIKTLGVIFDPELSFVTHIKNTSRIAFFHLGNIAKIRKMLSVHDAEKLVHAFVTSRLDYCNALLSGCANASLKPLQLVQNAVAVVNQQAATPTFPLHSTEARVDAAAAITNNADQLASIPRRLQNPCKS